MSKIGKKAIVIPEGVKIEDDGVFIKVSGKNGTLEVRSLEGVKANITPTEIVFEPAGGGKQGRANWGTIRALVQNAVLGVQNDFVKELNFVGVGYRVAVEGNVITLNVGFSHPVKIDVPSDIKASTEKNILKLSSPSKHSVGQLAASIRKIRKPNPYKGTGIMYVGEVIRRKAGKKVGK